MIRSFVVSLLMLMLMLAISPLPTRAGSPALPIDQFGMLPIAHEGRIKPLSVFAREELKLFSGAIEWKKQSATDWLAQMLFAPEKLEAERLISLPSEALRSKLELPLRATHRYSLQELRPALRTHLEEVLEAVLLTQKNRPVTPLQTSLASIYARVQHFQQLQDSLSFLLPLPWDKTTTYHTLTRKQPLPTPSPQLAQMEERGRMSGIFTIIPVRWNQRTEWHAPWQLRFNGQASPQSGQYVQQWGKMAQAYRAADVTAWAEAVTAAEQMVAQYAGSEYHPTRLWLEEWYYRLSFLSLAVVGYAVAMLLFIAMKPRWLIVPMLLCGGAMGLHGLALLVRMLILQRPPVSNLYESVLFVSLLIALAGGAMAWQQRRALLAAAAVGTAATLLLISQTLLDGQEQLPVVMAVLNTDFWLATHVICITAGYAASVLLSITAHYQLFYLHRPFASELPSEQSEARSVGFGEDSPTHKVQKNILPILALLLTAVGTLLGGIWADQSWGRFWGWDPKENGAMLIVLWLIWLMHGRLAGQFSQRWYLAGMAYLNVIVALAWFGVNLLSVGLHSYGFTEGTAVGLFAFIALETLIIAALLYRSNMFEYSRARHGAKRGGLGEDSPNARSAIKGAS